MKKLIIGMGVLVAVVTLGTVVPGLLMDGTHVSTRTADYGVPPEELWPVITDWQGNAAWRSDVDRVEVIESREESLVVFHGPQGRLPVRVTQMEAPERLVTQIADPELPFGGTWTWDLEPHEGGTRLVLTEHGEVYSAPMRTMAALFMDVTATQDAYLTELGEALGEQVQPGPAP